MRNGLLLTVAALASSGLLLYLYHSKRQRLLSLEKQSEEDKASHRERLCSSCGAVAEGEASTETVELQNQSDSDGQNDSTRSSSSSSVALQDSWELEADFDSPLVAIETDENQAYLDTLVNEGPHWVEESTLEAALNLYSQITIHFGRESKVAVQVLCALLSEKYPELRSKSILDFYKAVLERGLDETSCIRRFLHQLVNATQLVNDRVWKETQATSRAGARLLQSLSIWQQYYSNIGNLWWNSCSFCNVEYKYEVPTCVLKQEMSRRYPNLTNNMLEIVVGFTDSLGSGWVSEFEVDNFQQLFENVDMELAILRAVPLLSASWFHGYIDCVNLQLLIKDTAMSSSSSHQNLLWRVRLSFNYRNKFVLVGYYTRRNQWKKYALLYSELVDLLSGLGVSLKPVDPLVQKRMDTLYTTLEELQELDDIELDDEIIEAGSSDLSENRKEEDREESKVNKLEEQEKEEGDCRILTLEEPSEGYFGEEDEHTHPVTSQT